MLRGLPLGYHSWLGGTSKYTCSVSALPTMVGSSWELLLSSLLMALHLTSTLPAARMYLHHAALRTNTSCI